MKEKVDIFYVDEKLEQVKVKLNPNIDLYSKDCPIRSVIDYFNEIRNYPTQIQLCKLLNSMIRSKEILLEPNNFVLNPPYFAQEIVVTTDKVQLDYEGYPHDLAGRKGRIVWVSRDKESVLTELYGGNPWVGHFGGDYLSTILPVGNAG